MRKSQDDIINQLQQEVEISDMVQRKADQAFAQIQESMVAKGKRKMPPKKIVLIAAAITLFVGTVSVAATSYMQWGKGIEQAVKGTQEQKAHLEDSKMAVPVNETATKQGVTVTVTQSIVDSYYAHINFKVEGYDLPEGLDPSFEEISVIVDGKIPDHENIIIEDSVDWFAGFYNGWITEGDGEIAYADGEPRLEGEDPVVRYVREDGSLEFNMVLANTNTRDYLIGKPIHIELKNLGTATKADHISDINESWDFDWVLQGTDQSRECELNVPLEDTGITVTKAEISPISLRAVANYGSNSIDSWDEREDNRLPDLVGVKMKDGTLCSQVFGGPGSISRGGENSNEYVMVFATAQILDVDQIESLLFSRTKPGNWAALQEDEQLGKVLPKESLRDEDFYIVPLTP